LSEKIAFTINRPEGFSGKGDKYLPSLIKELEKYIKKIYGKLNYRSSEKVFDIKQPIT
jgi:hypothetical protein